jgi:hypothetical protein
VKVVVLVLGLAVFVAAALAVWRFSPAAQTVKVGQPVDYELTADCLAAHQSWRNFNSTLANLEHDLRFCIEVWPTAQLSAP